MRHKQSSMIGHRYLHKLSGGLLNWCAEAFFLGHGTSEVSNALTCPFMPGLFPVNWGGDDGICSREITRAEYAVGWNIGAGRSLDSADLCSNGGEVGILPWDLWLSSVDILSRDIGILIWFVWTLNRARRKRSCNFSACCKQSKDALGKGCWILLPKMPLIPLVVWFQFELSLESLLFHFQPQSLRL